MEEVVQTSAARGFDLDGRAGAVTPAAQRLSRPLGAIDVPHKKVEKICCIGAGYVGGSYLPLRCRIGFAAGAWFYAARTSFRRCIGPARIR
jgi:hypothetical protein